MSSDLLPYVRTHAGLELAWLGTAGVVILAAVAVAVLIVWRVTRPRHAGHRDASDVEHQAVSDTASPAKLCGHDDAVPVDLLLTGERVAWWCPACETQLAVAGIDSSR